jgi:hypothetical protein
MIAPGEVRQVARQIEFPLAAQKDIKCDRSQPLRAWINTLPGISAETGRLVRHRGHQADQSRRHSFPYTDGVYDGSDDEERELLEALMREQCKRPAKEICQEF